MAIRSLSDVLATFVAWFPFLAILVAAGYFLVSTGLFLEINSEGTEVFLDNGASVQHWNEQDVQEHRQTMRDLEQAAAPH